MLTIPEMPRMNAHITGLGKPNKAGTRKTLYSLDIDNYEPAVKALTFPLMRNWAKKIGADFHVITERKFPEWPVTYEKIQVGQLAKERGDEWAIFLDADALVNPECFDITNHLPKDTVAHNGKDMCGVRWEMDEYFRRDGRWIGSCNWLAIASEWCLDLWHELDDLTLEQALARIHPTINEHNSGHCKKEHLIDDYTLSRNISKFGLKFLTVNEICGSLRWKKPRVAFGAPIAGPDGKGGTPQTFSWGEEDASPFFYHIYAVSTEVKLANMLAVLSAPQDRGGWALMTEGDVVEFKAKWGLK